MNGCGNDGFIRMEVVRVELVRMEVVRMGVKGDIGAKYRVKK